MQPWERSSLLYFVFFLRGWVMAVGYARNTAKWVCHRDRRSKEIAAWEMNVFTRALEWIPRGAGLVSSAVACLVL